MSELKSTIMGFMTIKPNLLKIISYPFLSSEENDMLQNVFFINYCECPTLHNNPEILEMFLETGVKQTARQAQLLHDAWVAEYNPIENYRRVEETYRDTVGNIKGNDDTNRQNNKTNSEYGTNEGNVKNTSSTESEGQSENIDSRKGLTDNYVSAYDTTKMTLHDEQKSNDVNSNESTSSNTSNTKEMTADEHSYSTEEENKEKETVNYNTNRDSKEKEHITSVISGNVGVTTSQQMVESTIELAKNFDYYGIVARLIFENSNAFYYYFF